VEDLAGRRDEELAQLLDGLEEDERRVSARRQKLHELIRYRKSLGRADGTPATADELAELEARERELSRTRKELHARIDAVRRELTRRPTA
jgi:hypothetical protein